MSARAVSLGDAQSPPLAQFEPNASADHDQGPRCLAPLAQRNRPPTKSTEPIAGGTSLDVYRRRLSRFPQLSPEVERELSRRYREGDRRAGDRLIQACLPFVLMIAREYRCWGVPLEDVVQQGNLGLLKAAVRFDPERQCRLVTYAAFWIRAEIREYVVRGYRMVRLGTTKGERRALRTFRRTKESDPARLAELAGITTEAVEKLLPIIASRDVSVDAATSTGATILDRMFSNDETPEEQAILEQRLSRARHEIASFLRKIPARERTIVRERWMSERPVTLESLGQRFGISKERVRQLEERAMGQLRGRLLACPGLAEAC